MSEATRQHYQLAISGDLPVEDVEPTFKSGFDHGRFGKGELSDRSKARSGKFPVNRDKYSD